MRRALPAIALALTISTLLAVPPAGAEVAWVAGADFSVGGAYFSLGFQSPAVQPYSRYEPVYYYRVRQPLHYEGVHCTSACYLRDGYTYHHPSCPLVARHFAAYRFAPTRIWASLGVPYGVRGYAPPAYGYRQPPVVYYRGPRYDVHRYDRHDDGRRDHGRGHGRGHGHGHQHGPHCHH
ncbi:MAG: hypothetical protein R2991_13435 [Thermoanaerobaculia bacterium]